MKITLSQGILVNERSKEIDEFANIVKTIVWLPLSLLTLVFLLIP